MKHLIYIISILGLFSTEISSQENINLKHLIEQGLEHNYQIRITRNEQQISDNNAHIGNAGYLPTISLNSSIGGTESNTAQYPHEENEDIIKQTGISNQNLSAGVNLNWTIFDGFNIQAKYSSLKELQQIGELKTKMSVEAFVANLTAEYYNYIRECLRLDNLKSAVKLSAERLRIVDARYTIGDLSKLDLQQARVDFNADSSKLIQQQEMLFASKIRINQYIGNEKVNQELSLENQDIHLFSLLNKDELWNNLLENNSYLLVAIREKNLKLHDLQSARSTNFPYLKFNAGYSYSDNIYEYGTYKRQNNLGFNYGLTLGFNLFDGMNNLRKQKNIKLKIENRELSIEELKLALKSNFSNFWMAYTNNIELTKLEKENVEHAKENYEIAMERYKLGDLSGIELREAQNSLLEAEERLVQAQFNTKLSEISLLEISGEILRYME